MQTLTQVPDKMQQILTTTPDAAARDAGFVIRSRKLTGGRFVETLVFSWLENPDATYTQLAQTAGALGTPISRQAIEQRFTPEAAETLKTTLEAAALEVIIPFLVYIFPLENFQFLLNFFQFYKSFRFYKL